MASTSTNRARHFAVAAAAIALLLGGVWIANQGGIASPAPEKFFGTVYQVVRSGGILAAVWVGALGLGVPIRKALAPDARHWIVLQFAAGLGAMMMLDWLLAAFGLMNGWTSWGVCGIGTAVLTYHFADARSRDRWHPENWPSPPWTLLLALPALGVMIVACTCPPGALWSMEAFAYDVTSYHLQVPREWMALGRMASLEHNVYSHLPMLSEAAYMQLGAMFGHVYLAVYTTQLFHVSAAVMAAVAIAAVISDHVDGEAGALGSVLLLAMPWTLITGSLAYNEMFVLAFGAAAVMLAFDESARTTRGAVLIGVLCGLATLAKLPAGPMIALPVVLIVLLGLNRNGRHATGGDSIVSWQPRLAAFVVLGVALALGPYFVRNAVWTGNPVFPFATGVFGTAHWTPELAKRWHTGHASSGLAHGLQMLPRQWLLNTGFGAMAGGAVDHREATDIARFNTEYGVPLLWLVVAAGAGLLLAWRDGKRLAWAMLLLMAVQIIVWLVLTHHQSRFLIPTLLPGAILAGAGLGRLRDLTDKSAPAVFGVAAVGLSAVFTISSYNTLVTHTRTILDESGRTVHLPPYLLVDSLTDPADPTTNQPGRPFGQHPINLLPPKSRVLMVADAGNLLYIQRAVTYNTAFDNTLLGEIIDTHDGNPNAAIIDLLTRGYTHVWVHDGEIARLSASYGFDTRITRPFLDALAARCQRIPTGDGGVRLLQLPAVRVNVRPSPDSPDGENGNPTTPAPQP